jgi:hypothetical protein
MNAGFYVSGAARLQNSRDLVFAGLAGGETTA